MLVLQVLSLVVWAPVVEEIIFRGALYRYLRGYVRWWAAVFITALCFGLVHPYTTAGLVQVGIIGVIFGSEIQAVARQPEMKDELQSIRWLGFALTEAVAFYTFIFGLIAFFL